MSNLQDCVCLIAPYPNNPNPPETFNIATDFDMSGSGLLWYCRLQLLFLCTLCPASCSVMQQQGVPMLYDSASSSGSKRALRFVRTKAVLKME